METETATPETAVETVATGEEETAGDVVVDEETKKNINHFVQLNKDNTVINHGFIG